MSAEPNKAKKILVVEDEAVSRFAITSLLRHHGYEVIACAEGGEAVGRIVADRPDLILLDLGLPSPDPFGGLSFDGVKIMDWLKRMVPKNRPPIIVLSAEDPERMKRPALEAGALAFFQKPADPSQLLSAISIALGDSD